MALQKGKNTGWNDGSTSPRQLQPPIYLWTVQILIRAVKDRQIYEGIYFLFQGPNFLGHIDGYDKLKAYGFAIHGCIDG